MTKPEELERIDHGLIREHLARTKRKDILAQFDLDVPRKEDSLTKTKLIVQALGSGGKKLYKQNKESKKPLTSILDIISNHYYKVSSKKSRSKGTSSSTAPPPTKAKESIDETSNNSTNNSNKQSKKKPTVIKPVDNFFGFDMVEESSKDITNKNITVKENKPVQVGSFFQKPTSSIPGVPSSSAGTSNNNMMQMEDIGEDELYDFS